MPVLILTPFILKLFIIIELVSIQRGKIEYIGNTCQDTCMVKEDEAMCEVYQGQQDEYAGFSMALFALYLKGDPNVRLYVNIYQFL